MENQSEEKLKEYIIPLNYKVKGKWRNMYIRNILEAVVVIIAFASIIMSSRFIWQIKWFLMIGGAAGLGALFINGINDLSVTQWLISYIKYIYTKRKYHFENLEDIYGEAINSGTQDTKAQNSAGGTSRLDRIIRSAKSKKSRKERKRKAVS